MDKGNETRITREAFLFKIVPTFLVGVAVVELERLTGFLGATARQGVDNQVALGVIPEGDPGQRIVVFENVLRDALNRTGPDREKFTNEVVGPFITANAAEIAASEVYKWSLAGTALRHYLYGSGRLLDLSLTLRDEFTKVGDSKRKAQKQVLKPDPRWTGEDSVTNTVNYLLNDVELHDTPAYKGVRHIPDDIKTALRQGANLIGTHFRMDTVTGLATLNENFYYGANFFTLGADGTISSVQKNENGFTITLAPGSVVKMFDHYEYKESWKKVEHGITSGYGASLLEVTRTFLRTIGLPSDAISRSLATIFCYDQNQGPEASTDPVTTFALKEYRLTNGGLFDLAKNGYAKPFDTRAYFDTQAPIEIDVPNEEL